MKVYPWHETTKEALSPTEKPDNHPNPIGRCETATPTPENIPTGYAARAVLTNEGWFHEWEVVIDKRDTTYWSKDGSKHTITDLAVDVPEGCLETKPPSPYHRTHDGTAWVVDESMLSTVRRQERDDKLSSVYSPTIEQLSRWIDSAEDDLSALADYKAQRTVWHAWADALCDLPNQPGFPWPEGDVPWPEQPPKPTRFNPNPLQP